MPFPPPLPPLGATMTLALNLLLVSWRRFLAVGRKRAMWSSVPGGDDLQHPGAGLAGL